MRLANSPSMMSNSVLEKTLIIAQCDQLAYQSAILDIDNENKVGRQRQKKTLNFF